MGKIVVRHKVLDLTGASPVLHGFNVPALAISREGALRAARRRLRKDKKQARRNHLYRKVIKVGDGWVTELYW